jgi:hypothetical protein
VSTWRPPPGTIHALLGPNGSGKTTIVNILSTLIRPDAGPVRVAGHDVVTDPNGVRRAIGVTGQFSAVDALLTGRENLQLMADLHHLGRAAARRRIADLLATTEGVVARFKTMAIARTSVLTFISSAFVPTGTMPAAVRWFAQNQPYSPLIETMRSLLAGVPVDRTRAVLGLAWVAAIGLAGHLWARHLYDADPTGRSGGVAALMSR